MKHGHPISGADSRPRIWIRPSRYGFAWSRGPGGLRTECQSFGAACEDALNAVECRESVIIVEPAL